LGNVFFMKTSLRFLFLGLLAASFSFSVISDEDRIIEVLESSNLTHDFIMNHAKVNTATHSFDLVEEINGGGSKKEVNNAKYTYDGSKGNWELVLVNGKSASEKQKAIFYTGKKHVYDSWSVDLDPNTLKVEKDGKDEFQYSFRLNANTLSKDYSYFAHCTYYVKIDPASKHLKSIEVRAHEPFKISILKTNGFSVLTEYKWDVGFNEYLMQREVLDMMVHVFGQDTQVTETSTYTYVGQ